MGKATSWRRATPTIQSPVKGQHPACPSMMAEFDIRTSSARRSQRLGEFEKISALPLRYLDSIESLVG